MLENREASINLGGQTYNLLFNTKAAKEISIRHGGLDNLGDKLKKGNTLENIDEYIWLLTLLANQSILMHNLQNPSDQQELLSEEKVEILTIMQAYDDYGKAIFTAMGAGSKREVLSEDDPKNALAGGQATENCSPA